MSVKLLTEQYLEFLSLNGDCRSSSKSTPVKMSNCWKSHATAQLKFYTKINSSSADLKLGVKLPIFTVIAPVWGF